MNWLDFILIVLIIISFIVSIVVAVSNAIDDGIIFGIICFILTNILTVTPMLPFVIVDKNSGNTIGYVTSVDKNFFGTTALYVKTSETTQEKYCIEDTTLSKETVNYIGKQVKVSYGTRVGWYSTGKCSQAPVEKVEVIINE